jgi:putative ABC transport system permease protein
MDFRREIRDRLPPLAIQREPEIVDELAGHLAELYREARASGLDHDRAKARALAALPAAASDFARELESASRALPGLIADRWRTAHDVTAFPPLKSGGLAMLADLRRDLRYAIRMLARTPGFTFVVSLTAALGIGANAVIFSAVDAVLLRSAPVADPSSLVSIYTTSPAGPTGDRFSTSSYPDYLDLRESGALQDVAAFASIPLVLQTAEGAEPVPGELVTGNYFDVLGVTIAIGRAFSPDEDRSTAPVRVVVLSHAAWTNRFGGQASVVGRTISVNGNPYTIIGVAPRGFASPIVGRAPEMWAPAALQPELRPPSAGLRRSLGSFDLLSARGPRWLSMIGRLAPGQSVAAANAAAGAVFARLAADYPDSNRGRSFNIVPLGTGPGVRATTGPLLRLLTWSVIVVLLIACANVASLLLARAVTRRREIAVRMAVGAGRNRLVRQWLTESLLLSLLGAAGGLLIAWWGTPLLYQFRIPPTIPLGVTPRVLLFVIAVSVLSALLFGLAPIVQTLRQSTVDALRDEGGAVASGARATRMRSTLVVVQIALSVVLLAGAGLFLRTLHAAASVDLGYDVDRVLLADINMDVRGYAQDTGQLLYSRLLERVNALPGVATSGAARVTVLSGGARTTDVSTDGRPVAQDESNAISVRANTISEGYLGAMGIRLRAGRNFLPTDGAATARVAIISESLASRLYPGADAVGRPLMVGRDPLQVVGVVPDTVYRSAIERNAPPFFYVPLRQNYESGITLHIRTSTDPQSLVPALRRALHEIDSQLVLGRPRLLREEFEQSLGDQRMLATMVGLFGLVALALAGIGLYGVMAHLAGQRRAEVGIRLALGAPRASIFRLMLRDGLRLVAIGSAIGLAAAFAGARYVEHQLFGVTAADPATFLAVGGTLFAVALAACLIPAHRAMQVDPALALRGN